MPLLYFPIVSPQNHKLALHDLKTLSADGIPGAGIAVQPEGFTPLQPSRRGWGVLLPSFPIPGASFACSVLQQRERPSPRLNASLLSFLGWVFHFRPSLGCLLFPCTPQRIPCTCATSLISTAEWRK